MDKITEHPLIIKLEKVFNSCRTMEQFVVADRYSCMIKRKIIKEEGEWDINYISNIITYIYELIELHEKRFTNTNK